MFLIVKEIVFVLELQCWGAWKLKIAQEFGLGKWMR